MRGLGLLGLFTITWTGVCGTRSLLPGDAERGQELFRTQNCITCHSINGKGGTAAPDLGKGVDRSYSPSQMVAFMWNHAPVMWAAMESKGIRKPELSEQQAADLFAYFFLAGYFEPPGNARRGKQVLRSKQCGECHGIASSVREGVKPVAAWQSLENPIALAQQMWNHSREMKAALSDKQIAYPRLTSQEITDLLAYLRDLPETRGRPGEFSPASAENAQTLFAVKGCAGCHKDALALEARPTRYSLTEFAAAMWNHPSRTTHDLAPLSYEEMRRLVGYLCSLQFVEERGDPERGQKVLAKKKCTTCHNDPSRAAPSLAAVKGRMTSFAMVAALWEHGLAMLNRMRGEKIPWPRFTGSEMADLTAYLHGREFKRRQVLSQR